MEKQRYTKRDRYRLGCSTGHARGSSQGAVIWAALHSCNTVCAAGLSLQEAFVFSLPHLLGLKPHPCWKPLGLPSHVLLRNCHPGTPAWPRGTWWAGLTCIFLDRCIQNIFLLLFADSLQSCPVFTYTPCKLPKFTSGWTTALGVPTC